MRYKELGSNFGYLLRARMLIGVLLCLTVSACTTDLQMKVSGNLNQLSQNQTVAILPIEIANSQQRETALLFRQSLHANLQESNFNLLEHYIIDQLLKKNGLTPEQSVAGHEVWDKHIKDEYRKVVMTLKHLGEIK